MKKIKLIALGDTNIRVHKIADSLIKVGNDVEVLLLDRKIVNKKDSYVEENYKGVPIKRFFCRKKEDTSNYGRLRKNILYAFWFLGFILKLRKYLKTNECDCIIAQANIGTFAGLMSKKHHTKIIYDMRELYEGRGKKISTILKIFNKYLIRKSNYILYLNDKQKSMINPKYYAKLVYLPNYASIEHFSNIKKTPSSKIRIGYIGCPRDYLSLSNLILASQKYCDSIEIFIHGIGDAYEKLKLLEKEYDNLKVTGVYDGIKDSEKLYQNIDLLFCGYDINNINWKNAIAVKYYESLITLTPVMVFDDSKMGELTKENNNGILVKSNSILDFEKALEQINKSKLKEFTNNIKPIQFNFTWEKIIENLYQII